MELLVSALMGKKFVMIYLMCKYSYFYGCIWCDDIYYYINLLVKFPIIMLQNRVKETVA